MNLKDHPEPTRLNLWLTPNVKQRLESLQARTKAESFTDVFRAALAVYELLIEHIEKGGKLTITDPDGTSQELDVLFAVVNLIKTQQKP